jgi:ribosome biogenesis GTPase
MSMGASSYLANAGQVPTDQETASGLLGTVLAVQANYYWVRLDKAVVPPGQPADLLCTRRTRLKKIGQQVMVGDRVAVEEPDWAGERGAIAAVYPRQTELDRPPVANANQILLVFALAEPQLDPWQLSRFLVKAESTGLTVQLCLNKCDLATATEQQQWCDRVQAWGYDPILISAVRDRGLDQVQGTLQDQTSVISGPSGVGKSSLINRLIPAASLRTGAVSGKLGRGRHTTRHVELFELPGGGLLADTPGFNQPDLQCLPQELAHFFPEARQRLAAADCQFSDCLHRDEPNCAVRGDWERYEHYLTFLEDAIAYQATVENRADAESTVKVKVSQDGSLQEEPKLSPKKYRRSSRRSQRQALQDLRYDRELLDNLDNLDDDL